MFRVLNCFKIKIQIGPLLAGDLHYACKKEKKEEYRKYTLNFNRAEEGNKREEDNIQQLLNEFNRLNQRIKIECK